jgi:hypothetical protein
MSLTPRSLRQRRRCAAGSRRAGTRALYPYLTEERLAQAIDLESQLEANLAIRVAA